MVGRTHRRSSSSSRGNALPLSPVSLPSPTHSLTHCTARSPPLEWERGERTVAVAAAIACGDHEEGDDTNKKCRSEDGRPSVPLMAHLPIKRSEHFQRAHRIFSVEGGRQTERTIWRLICDFLTKFKNCTIGICCPVPTVTVHRVSSLLYYGYKGNEMGHP